jgi:tRNA pseudouridine55 synthase
LSSPVFGFLNIDKPLGITSHDVVAKIRRATKIKKVGHAGTLDPLATGVLVICIGAATRLSEYVMNSTKRYRATVFLGVVTDTYDAEGEIIRQTDASHISRDRVENSLQAFLGDIQQIPPIYSAIKQGGRKLYDVARSGETVELTSRPVRIEALKILEWSPPEFTLDVTCSAGTYIRSLAFDLGEALGTGAHLSGLTRMASGIFSLETALRLDDVLAAENWQEHLLSPRQALADWPVVELSDSDADHIRHGRSIDNSTLANEGLAMGFQGAELVTVLQAADGRWRPHKVFSAVD